MRFPPARAGFTIVELAIAATVAAIIAGSAVALFIGLRGLDRQGRNDLAVATARIRLADQFRADVAAASDCRWIDEKNLAEGVVLLGPAGQSVRYVAAEGQIERLVARDDKTVGHDVYRLGDGTETSFQIGSAAPPLVTATINAIVRGGHHDQELPPAAVVRRSEAIVALLGRRQRLIETVARATAGQSGPEKNESDSNPSPDSTQP